MLQHRRPCSIRVSIFSIYHTIKSLQDITHSLSTFKIHKNYECCCWKYIYINKLYHTRRPFSVKQGFFFHLYYQKLSNITTHSFHSRLWIHLYDLNAFVINAQTCIQIKSFKINLHNFPISTNSVLRQAVCCNQLLPP